MLGAAALSALTATLGQAPVILGPIVFIGNEVPSRITVGGAHLVRIHRLPGGGRIFDAMGADDAAITWSGFFTGPLAAERARLVDMMRQNGEAVGLSFGDYAFTVVVVHFQYDLQDRGAFISYRIRAEIIPPLVVAPNDTAFAMAANLSNDLEAAQVALSASGLESAIAVLDAALSTQEATSLPASPAGLALLLAGLHSASVVVRQSMVDAGSSLVNVTTAATITPTVLLGSVAAASSLASCTQAAGYLNRGQTWLMQLDTAGPGTSPITA